MLPSQSNPFLSLPEDQTLQEIAIQARDEVVELAAKQKTVPTSLCVTSNQLAAVKKIREETGVKAGDLVTVSWREDGGGLQSQIGIVASVGEWINITGRGQSGHLQIPMWMLHKLHVERHSATEEAKKSCVCEGPCDDDCKSLFVGQIDPTPNPFMDLPATPANPFLAL